MLLISRSKGEIAELAAVMKVERSSSVMSSSETVSPPARDGQKSPERCILLANVPWTERIAARRGFDSS